MKALLAVLIALPLTARATMISVDYDGVVASSSDADYSVGDPFSGSLTIDSSVAPPDLAPENRAWGLDGSADLCQCTANFVTGFQDISGARASDLGNLNLGVQGNPDYPMGYGQIDINDVQGNGTANRKWLELTAQLGSLLNGDGLVQSFEVSSPQGVHGLLAKLKEGWGAAKTAVRFTLSRFSMTPTAASPPVTAERAGADIMNCTVANSLQPDTAHTDGPDRQWVFETGISPLGRDPVLSATFASSGARDEVENTQVRRNPDRSARHWGDEVSCSLRPKRPRIEPMGVLARRMESPQFDSPVLAIRLDRENADRLADYSLRRRSVGHRRQGSCGFLYSACRDDAVSDMLEI